MLNLQGCGIGTSLRLVGPRPCRPYLGYATVHRSLWRQIMVDRFGGGAREAGVVPDQYVIGTLLGNAASRSHYEYLVHVMKEMRYQRIPPNAVIIRILERALNRVPQSPTMRLRYDGFKGYYILWKRHYPDVSSDDDVMVSEMDTIQIM